MQIAAWPASAKIFSVVAFRVDQPEQALFQDGVISVPQRQGEAQQLLHDCILFYEYFHGDNGAGIGASHQTGWTGIVAKLIELFGYLDPDVFQETPDLLKVSASAPLASTNAESPRRSLGLTVSDLRDKLSKQTSRGAAANADDYA